MNTFLLISVILLTSQISFAQSGKVTVYKDDRINDLIKQSAPIIAPFKVPTIVGFRIQLAFDAEKATVENARTKFITQYPKIDTYMNFEAPNFFLKVGDFRTKLETERILKSIQSSFPTAFIIKERINLPRIDQ